MFISLLFLLLFLIIECNSNALLRKAEFPVEAKLCIIMVTILFIFVCVIIAVFHYLNVKEIGKLKQQIKDVDCSLSELNNKMVAIQELKFKLISIANDINFIKTLTKNANNQNSTDHFDIIKYNKQLQSTVTVYSNQIKEKIEKLSKENINLSDAILKTIDDKCLTFKPTTKSNTKQSASGKPKASKSKAKNSCEDLNVTDNAQESK